MGSKRVPFKIMLSRLRKVIFVGNSIIILALLILHFVIKDSKVEFEYWFYLFPLPIIIVVILVSSAFLGKRRKYNLILAGLLLCVWFFRSFRFSFSEDVIESDVEVVFWNCARDNSFKTAFLENEGIPDIMVLSESEAISLDEIKKKYPKYYFYKSNFQIDIFSKTPINIEKEQKSKFKSAVIKFNSAGINFYVVDMIANLQVSKTSEFNFERQLVKNTENTIVLGDFNVPYESRFLDDLKNNYNHYFSKKGNGFRETWPWNVPLLSIDHIWVSKDLKIINSEKINTRNSDHSIIKTVIRK